ncbi:hypothetical protein N9Q55_03820 [Flavobacteriaceae bacterium]|nr:hypothetical protein [Flavobacteriaceae bacterium]
MAKNSSPSHKLNPKSGKSEYIKGLALINLGRNEAACELFKAAKSIGMLLQTKRFKHIVNKPTWL